MFISFEFCCFFLFDFACDDHRPSEKGEKNWNDDEREKTPQNINKNQKAKLAKNERMKLIYERLRKVFWRSLDAIWKKISCYTSILNYSDINFLNLIWLQGKQQRRDQICGRNNITYNSYCHMIKDSCNTGYFIDVQHQGTCQSWYLLMMLFDPMGQQSFGRGEVFLYSKISLISLT